MSGLNDIFAIAQRALQANQYGMDVTGKNISNAQNPNYSRQLVDFVGGDSVESGDFLLGMGVEIASIRRTRDEIFDVKIWLEKGTYGQLESQGKYSKMIEGIFNDFAGAGLSDTLDEFWNAWAELSNFPDSTTVRNSLKVKTKQLTDKLNSMDADLRELGNISIGELEDQVNRVNQITRNILKLNEQIQKNRSYGATDNALLDQRDALLGSLSSYIDVSVSFHDDGLVSVYSGGRVLVDRKQSFDFEVKTENNNSNNRVYLTLYGGEEVDLKTGSMKGLIDSTNISAFEPLNMLDGIAKSLTEEVNAVHRNLYDLDGETGKDFFVSTGTTAGSIRLTSEIMKQSSGIAVSKNTQAGDGSGALDISTIRDMKVTAGRTINDSYRDVVAYVGQSSRTLEDEMETQQGAIELLENQRQSIMGVSLEEEMINLIRFQNAFEAASKMIVTVDEMLQTVINMKS